MKIFCKNPRILFAGVYIFDGCRALFGSAGLIGLILFATAAYSEITFPPSDLDLIADEIILPMPEDRKAFGDDWFFQGPRHGYRVRTGEGLPLEQLLGGFIERWAFRYPLKTSDNPIQSCMIGPNCMNAVTSALELELEQRQTESNEFEKILDDNYVEITGPLVPGDIVVYSRWNAVSHAALFVGTAHPTGHPEQKINIFFHKLGANYRAPYIFTSREILDRASRRFGARSRVYRRKPTCAERTASS